MSDPQSNPRFGNGHEHMSANPDAVGFEDLIPEQGLHALADQEQRVREFIQAHPLAVIAGALVIGFAFARALRGSDAW
jgi:hypothetical protein